MDFQSNEQKKLEVVTLCIKKKLGSHPHLSSCKAQKKQGQGEKEKKVESLGF